MSEAGEQSSGQPDAADLKQRYHPFFYIGGTFLNAVVFVSVGPLVGGLLLVMVAMIFQDPLRGGFQGVVGYFALFPLTIPMSYYLGAKTAAITGACVAVLSAWIGHEKFLYVAAALIGAVVAIVSFEQMFPNERLTQNRAASLIFAGAGASLVCTRIARPFRLSAPPGDPLPSSIEAK